MAAQMDYMFSRTHILAKQAQWGPQIDADLVGNLVYAAYQFLNGRFHIYVISI